MKTKLLNLLSMSRKAGKAALGFDPMREALSAGKAAGVFIAEDISPKTEKEVRFFADKNSVSVVRLPLTQDELYFGIGKKVGVVTLCDKGFADRAVQLVQTAHSEN